MFRHFLCVLCLLLVLCSIFKSLSKRSRLFPNISHLRLHLGSIYKLLHPAPSLFSVLFHLQSYGCSLELFHTTPSFFLLRWKPCCFSTDYQMTEWILLLSMRHSVNVNHIRHKLIHLNGIETIYVFRIALNGGRPVDMLWTTRTKCLLLFFFSVTRNTFEGTTKSVESGTCVKYFSKTEIKGTLTI